jgi:hypothetical protein
MANNVNHANQTFVDTVRDDIKWGVGGAFGFACYMGGGPTSPGCYVLGGAAAGEAVVPTIAVGAVHGSYNAYKEAFTDPGCQ